MEDQGKLLDILSTHGEASAVLSPLLTNLPLLGLLRGALRSGLLALARQPHTSDALARALQLEESQVVEVCYALDAHGVFIQDGMAYRLEERWATLADPDMPFLLEVTIDYALARMHVLEHALSGSDNYWSLSPQSRLALAKGVTANPASPHSPALVRMITQAVSPELDARLAAGGRLLDLGCGIGGGLLSMLRAYPHTSAVGVDIAADVLEEAQRQAVALGVGDRVRFVHGDARAYDGREAFDFVFWAQFFFPTPTRAGTLEVAFHALKPGGYIVSTLLEAPSPADENLRTDEGRELVLTRIMYGYWGIPLVGAQEIQAELEAAGFTNAELVRTPLGNLLMARRS